MKNRKGFTLVEALLVVVIIGVVAALTLPQLLANYQKKMLCSQLKKEWAAAQQGIMLMIQGEQVDSFRETSMYKNGFWNYSGSNKQDFQNVVNKYFKASATEYGSPSVNYNINYEYLSMVNPLSVFSQPAFAAYTMEDICPNGSCYGSSSEYEYSSGSSSNSSYDSSAHHSTGDSQEREYEYVSVPRLDQTYHFELNNGAILYYNSWNHNTTAGLLYIDVNGRRGPNVADRDLFSFYVKETGVLEPVNRYGMGQRVGASRIKEDGWKMNY